MDAIGDDPGFDSIRRRYAGDDAWLGFLIDAVFLRDVVSNAYKDTHGREVVHGIG